MKRRIPKVQLFLALLLALAILSPSCRPRKLKANMTMLEVEKMIGKPDRIETVPGEIDVRSFGRFEKPTVIRWYYSKFPVQKSGPDYATPGHINFVPLCFTEHDPDSPASDKFAREYGEQSGVYRTFSYTGSFPTKKHYWSSLGSLDAIPVKHLPNNGKTTE